MLKAAVENRSLQPLSILIGEWATVGDHPLVPNTVLKGKTTFEWIQGGAFIIMHNHIQHKDFPDGVAIFGSDDSDEEYSMIYFDERNISRKYGSTIKDNVWKWWRNDKEFAQRFTGKISKDGNTIVSQGEMARNGNTWEKDLALTYTRISP